jgi:hypothetical protein
LLRTCPWLSHVAPLALGVYARTLHCKLEFTISHFSCRASLCPALAFDEK